MKREDEAVSGYWKFTIAVASAGVLGLLASGCTTVLPKWSRPSPVWTESNSTPAAETVKTPTTTQNGAATNNPGGNSTTDNNPVTIRPAQDEPAVEVPEVPEIFSPALRGSPFYSGLRPETEGRSGTDTDVDVSPSGSHLAFASTRFSADPKIFVQEVKSGALYQKSSGPGRDIQPKFSPDGKFIAFASNRSGNYDILVIRSDRNEAYWQLTRALGDEIHPTWSPDGERIAYSAREPNGEWNLWIIELEGQRRTQLGPGLYPEWSPDGENLVFQRPSKRGEGWYGIWVVPAKGGAPREIATHETYGFVQPSWSPDSQRLVFATVGKERVGDVEDVRAQDLWVVDLDDGNRFRLTQHHDEDYAPAWGLDGRIYFTSHREGRSRIWSLEPAPSPKKLFDRKRTPRFPTSRPGTLRRGGAGMMESK